MKFHDDMNVAFAPLLSITDERTVSQYMYMGHDKEKTHYKHFGTREYFYIKHNGQTIGKLENPDNWI